MILSKYILVVHTCKTFHSQIIYHNLVALENKCKFVLTEVMSKICISAKRQKYLTILRYIKLST